MEVEDRLPSAGTDVKDGTISLLDVALAGDLGGGEMAVADDFGVRGFGFFQPGKMFLGNDENVSGSLRVDVFEGEHVVVFIDFFRWNLAANNAAEEAVGGRVGHSLPSFYRMKSEVKSCGTFLA